MIGSSEPTFLDRIKGIFPGIAKLIDSFWKILATKFIALVSYILSNPPTESDYAAHNAALDTLAADGQKLMLVGHSQGNLFMNHAYDHILPVVGANRVAAAHIAPASPTLRGDYVLTDIDIVINALRVQGLMSVFNNNLDMNASSVDYSGHTLVGTYLDGTRAGRGKIKTMIEVAMGKLNCISFVNISNGLTHWSWEKYYLMIWSCFDATTLAENNEEIERQKSLWKRFDISDEFGEYVYENNPDNPSCLNNWKEYHGEVNSSHYGFISYSAHYADGTTKIMKEQAYIFDVKSSYLINKNITDFNQLPLKVRSFFNLQ